jgi:hypothetical protein
VGGERFLGESIELAATGVPLDRPIELLRVEGLEPGTEPGKLALRQPLPTWSSGLRLRVAARSGHVAAAGKQADD